jgi:hypothetical protein
VPVVVGWVITVDVVISLFLVQARHMKAMLKKAMVVNMPKLYFCSPFMEDLLQAYTQQQRFTACVLLLIF